MDNGCMPSASIEVTEKNKKTKKQNAQWLHAMRVDQHLKWSHTKSKNFGPTLHPNSSKRAVVKGVMSPKKQKPRPRTSATTIEKELRE